MKNSNSIKVGLEVGKKIMIHAKGNPATIVAVGVAAAIATVGTIAGYTIYEKFK